MKKKRFNTSVVSLIFAFMLIFFCAAVPSYAADDDRTTQTVPEELTDVGNRKAIAAGKSYGPIDMDAYMQAALAMSTPDSSADGKNLEIESASRQAKMFNSLMANNWLITRMVMFGMTNLDTAATSLENGTYLANYYTLLNNMQNNTVTGTGKNSNAVMDADDLSTDSWKQQIEENQAQVHAATAYQNAVRANDSRAESIKQLAQSNLPGIGGNNSIYDRISWIGIILLCVTFVVRLAICFWRLTIGTNKDHETPGLLIVECVAKFIVFLAIIHLLKWGIMALMMFSELVRNVLISASGNTGGTGDIAEQMQALMSAKKMLVASNGGTSWLDWVFNGLETFKAKVAGGIAQVFFYITSAIVTAMVILADVMMAIAAALGPLIVAISMIKGFEGWLDNYIRSIVQYALILPIAAIYVVTMIMVLALAPDIGLVTYIAISWAFFFGATRIPNLAEAMSGAALATLLTAFLGKIVTAAMAAAHMPVAHLMKRH